MRSKLLFACAALAVFMAFTTEPINKEVDIYRDPRFSATARAEDLLSKMTLEEKIAQLNQLVGPAHMKAAMQDVPEEELRTNSARGFYPGLGPADIEALTEKGMVGSFLHVVSAEEANHLQQLAQKSRLRIPLLIGIDAIHGNGLVEGCTIYPTSIGMASTFDPALMERTARQTAIEMRATGSQWTFNPNLEVSRDPRWGRVGETFGEDPYLISEFGKAAISGYQGTLSDESVLACVKHFLGGTPLNGTNGAPADVSERTLREVYLPPFRAGIDAGAFTVMTAHNELNGVPSHANAWLLHDILRKEWGFKGFVVSDWMDLENIHWLHKTAADIKEAYFQSIDAGMDMHMHGPEFFYKVLELVKEGRISEARINESCRKILEAKFRLGLFENSMVNIEQAKTRVFTAEHQATSLEAARKSIVLLKNDGILPLDEKKPLRIFVTGPLANNQGLLGDWSFLQPEPNVITVLEGLRKVAPGADINVGEMDWNIRKMDSALVDQAAAKARDADVNIVVVGEYALRQQWNERTGGEDSDRSDINLPGLQQELIEKIQASGKPVIVVLINGRPLGVEWIAKHCPALIEAWEPGSFGGQAIAEIIFGKINPGGKLPITIPRHVGQVQQYYNHKPSMYFHPYVMSESTPLFQFGYGLSYTTFEYSDIRTDKKNIGRDGKVQVSVQVRNSGKMAGEEVVQLYVRDEYSSVTRPVKELKDFRRIQLNPGENRTVVFELPASKLAFYDKNMVYGVEPGSFKIMVGGSSRDEDLLAVDLVVG